MKRAEGVVAVTDGNQLKLMLACAHVGNGHGIGGENNVSAVLSVKEHLNELATVEAGAYLKVSAFGKLYCSAVGKASAVEGHTLRDNASEGKLSARGHDR